MVQETQTLQSKISETRQDIAGSVGIETVGSEMVRVGREQLPWLNEAVDVNLAVAKTEDGNPFRIGTVVGANKKIAGIATTEFAHNPEDEDGLNAVMLTSITEILRGNPGAVKQVRNSPDGVTIYYGGKRTGARVFFASPSGETSGIPTFFKVGVCRTKNSEPKILSVFTRKKEKVK